MAFLVLLLPDLTRVCGIPISCEHTHGLDLPRPTRWQQLAHRCEGHKPCQRLPSRHIPRNGRLTFRRPICLLKSSEKSFFLLVPSSSLCLPSLSSYLQATVQSTAARSGSRRCIRTSGALLPLKAVTLLSSLVEIRLEAEGSSGRLALGFGLRAERRRPLQLGSHGFGVPAEVARSGAVWGLVAEEPGDGGVATAEGRTEQTQQKLGVR